MAHEHTTTPPSREQQEPTPPPVNDPPVNEAETVDVSTNAMMASLVEASETWATEGVESPDEEAPQDAFALSRRSFLQSSGVAGLVATFLGTSSEAEGTVVRSVVKDKALGPDGIPVTFSVNGKNHSVKVEARETLAEVLRERLGLTGTKVVCDRGSCGGCTVHLNGQPVCSCLMLAVDVAGAQVTTVEGLAQGQKLDPLQQAFIECDALQCGFCTPGMLMSCKALLNHNSDPTLQDVKDAVAGNLCRCGTYPHVFKAVLLTAQRQRSKKG